MMQASLINTDSSKVVDQLFELPETKLDCVNWSEYPYKPSVTVRLGYSSSALAILFEVEEEHLRAVTMEDCGPVWEDSCCEFFMADPAGNGYFNFEMAAKRKSQTDYEFLNEAQMAEIQRFSSLPHAPIDSVGEGQKYWVAEVIPFSILGLGEAPKSIKANFYKCGDSCQDPHYLSWVPIDLPSPCFHCPEFFQEVTFKS